MSEGYRIERDTMGEVRVSLDKMWGGQTQRSLENFQIGVEKMPKQVVQALTIVKKAAAIVNNELGKLDKEKKDSIVAACDEILEGKWDSEFPLAVWQTGSGTQSNMNVNEVIANRANQILKKEKCVHPNDHVNMAQSTNDVFPGAMHIAAVIEITEKLFPALVKLRDGLEKKALAFAKIIKIGRTHLQDATPLTLGQEFSGYVAMLDASYRHIEKSLEYLRELAIGGTAVGTGINAHPKFGEMIAETITKLVGKKFVSNPKIGRAHV